MRALGDKWRDEASAAKCVDEFALFFRVQDLTGWLWEQTDDVANTVFLNKQSAMPMARPMAAVRFGPAALGRERFRAAPLWRRATLTVE